MKLLSVAYLLPSLLLISSAAQLGAQISEVGKLVPSSGAGSQWFGWSVSVSGNRALVGSPRDGVLAYQHVGSAYVFERDAGGAWTEVAKLQASDGALGDGFGISVSLNGDRALIAAEDDDDLGLNSGSAYVFERDGQGTWTQVAKLLASDGAFEDSFGYSVAIAGDCALVGSWGHDDLGANSGSAYMFERGAGGAWTQVAKFLASDGAAVDLFGWSVSVSGDRAFVGALGDDDLGLDSGAVYVFEREAGATWIEVAKLLANDGAGLSSFGMSVSLSGDRALVGSVVQVPFGGLGQVHVLERDAGGIWTQVAKLVPYDPIYYASFGGCVSLSGDRALVGAPWGDGAAFQSGAAYLFARDSAGIWNHVKFLPSDGSYHQRFGHSVSISGDQMFVGSPADADGSAYIFEEAACDEPLPPSEAVRLGSPPNPNALLPGLTNRPVLASVWDPIIDHTTFMPGAVLDYLGITANPLNLHVNPIGTLLCDPALTIATAWVAPGDTFKVPIPGECVFAGVSVCTQGASIDSWGTLRLTNALDITMGTFW